MDHKVTVLCPAKVNLGLEVLHRRADGYHDICTVMQALDLYDELSVELADPPAVGVSAGSAEPGSAPEIEVSGPFAREVPAEGNTLLTAWAVAGGAALPPLLVTLVKNVPAGAGLGGGSSDGAGMLVALRELVEMIADSELRTQDLSSLAQRVGSDAPSFLSGGCQLAAGRGERLTPLKRKLSFHVLLAVPQFSSATQSAYAALRRSAARRVPMLTPQLARALESGDRELAAQSVVNDFEPWLAAQHPEYREWLEVLRAAGAFAATITGSGSGFFGLFAETGAAESTQEQLRGLHPWRYLGVRRPLRF